MNTPHILAIDDEPAFLGMLRCLFCELGYKVSTAKNGEEGLAKLKEETPDLVILDVVMSGMNGYEVLTEIRKTSNVPVMMLTARVQIEDVLAAKHNCVPDAYVDKTEAISNLISTVEFLLDPEKSEQTDSSKSKRAFMTRMTWRQRKVVGFIVLLISLGSIYVILNVLEYLKDWAGKARKLEVRAEDAQDISDETVREMLLKKGVEKRYKHKRIEWTKEMIAELGTDLDRNLAQRWGVSLGAVVNKRLKQGIKPVSKSKR